MKRIAVLRGGPSSEYEVSMRGGRSVLDALDTLELPYKDIVITQRGEWLDGGFVKLPYLALQAVDVVFIALHGEYGENGQVQKILEQINIPYTGSTPYVSAVAFNKDLTKRKLQELGLKMPKHRRLCRDQYLADKAQMTEELVNELGSELIVKPVFGSSSLNVRFAPTREALATYLEELFNFQEQLLVEEFIRGHEATVGVLGGFRGEALYTMPVIEIVPPAGKPFYSNNDKRSGGAAEIVPGRFSYSERSLLSEAARLAHETLGCRHYSRSDFIVSDGQVYFLEINTLPGLTKESLLPKAAQSIGLDFTRLVSHLVNQVSTV